mmetsp:Transcript_6410/g.20457  ORF Transcript_6410/g.20457 Transcript_6410/m.20457 type:complete len:402 (-) Transcript_6410:103-1308(-)
MQSTTARRTRHCRSSASSSMAGSSAVASSSTPSRALTAGSALIRLRRTSGNSSLSSCRKSGSSVSMVAPLPTSGARPMMSDARDARTCCDPSLHSSATTGRIWLTTSSGASMREKAASLTAAAVRTSASGSCSSLTKVGAISYLVRSGERDGTSSQRCSATTYRTRHDRSCDTDRTMGSTTAWFALTERSCPTPTQFSTASSRTESCSSAESAAKSGSSSVLRSSSSPAACIAAANEPRLEAAARLTMGVSSWHSCEKEARISAFDSAGSRPYAAAKRPQAEIREVNQSLDWSRSTSGTRCSSRCATGTCRDTLLSASTDLSRTSVSSTVASVSSGPRRTGAYSSPPTYSTNPPSSSASATSTSSSSSIDSLRKGISSFRVRSGPSATAIVESLLIELRRS